MASVSLSELEKRFIIDGVKENYRSDGRSNNDFRPMEIETDVVSHASGSARLRLANTDILVGVKTEIDEPDPQTPDMGKIEFFVDCSANATPEFEGRGGEQLAASISNCLQQAYHSADAFDSTQLCIMVGKQCWKLYVDILILECGGNLYDAVSLAVKSALYNTRIPNVTAALMDGGNVDLQLSDDPYDCKKLEAATAPLLVTVLRIPNVFQCIVDASAEEEQCTVASLVVGVIGNPSFYNGSSSDEVKLNRISTINTNGWGTFQIESLKKAIQQGIDVATAVDKALSNALLREQKIFADVKKDTFGFLR